MDQVLSTLRLTWQWRRLFRRALVLPLLGMAALMVLDWRTGITIDVSVMLGAALFGDSESGVAYAIVRSVYGALYWTCIAVAVATIVETIATGPAAAAHWLPRARAGAFVAALAVASFGAALVVFSGQQMVRAAIGAAIEVRPDAEIAALVTLERVLDVVELTAPVVAIVAIPAARRSFAAAAAATRPPALVQFVNAALIAVVAATATDVAATALHGRALPDSLHPALDTALGLGLYLLVDAVWIAILATTIAVAAFGRPVPVGAATDR